MTGSSVTLLLVRDYACLELVLVQGVNISSQLLQRISLHWRDIPGTR